MKREAFNRVIAFCNTPGALSKESKFHSHTITEEFESYCFVTHKEDIKRFSALIKHAKETGQYKLWQEGGKILEYEIDKKHLCPVSEYLTVKYNKVEDRISISLFSTGWKYARKKNILYPFKSSRPILCYGKELYKFVHFRNGKLHKPRRLMVEELGGKKDIMTKILQALMNIDFVPTISTKVSDIENAKDEWEVVQRKTGVKVPKALHIFAIEDMMRLVSVMSNPGELNTLCQFLSANKVPLATIYQPDPPDTWRGDTRPIHRIDKFLATYLEHMDRVNKIKNGMFEESKGGQLDGMSLWLIRDYINDLHALKMKTFSLKMTSATRMKAEHNRLSIIRRAKGIKKIKIHEDYKVVEKELKEKLDVVQDVEIIKKKERLLEEGIQQQHCVATYGESINKGYCVIASVVYNNQRYTCEINRINTDAFPGAIGYSMRQCRGIQNKNAPEELQSAINIILDSIVGSSLTVA